jgi:hypothetical protein
VRKEEIDQFARQRPFQPFTIRLVDGQVFRFDSPEKFFVSRSAIHTLDEKGDGLIINLMMIATIKRLNGPSRKK